MNEKGQAPEVFSSREKRNDQDVSFAHVQLFVDKLEELHVYKVFEKNLNEFHSRIENEESNERFSVTVEGHQHIWMEVSGSSHAPTKFTPQNRDIVKQLMAGFGFRVTKASRSSTHQCKAGTRSFLVTSRDPRGIQFIVTAPEARDVEDADFFSRGRSFIVNRLSVKSCSPTMNPLSLQPNMRGSWPRTKDVWASVF